jgi:hypothetical protein
MFNFLHPKSVVSRRAVAVMIVRQEARATINADTVLYALPSQHRQKAPLNEVNKQSPVIPLRRSED